MAEFDITINGTSIKSNVASFAVTFNEDSPFNTVDVTINNDSWLDTIAGDLFGSSPNIIPSTPQLKVLTGISSTDTTQGLFFIERPSLVEDKSPENSTLGNTIWGRNIIAKLDNPFAAPLYLDLSKHFIDKYKLASEVVDYICAMYGLTVSSFDITDFKIYTDWVTQGYPIDIIKRIVETTDGYVRSTKGGELWIKKKSYHTWGSSYVTISSTSLAQPRISRRFQYPAEFVNRVRFLATGTTGSIDGNISVSLSSANSSLLADGSSTTVLTAWVTQAGGEAAADGTAVSWSIDDNYGTLSSASTTTKTQRINDEKGEASWFDKVYTRRPISRVVSVVLDGVGGTNYYTGGSFSGTKITLGRKLPHNNSFIKITYYAKGYSENTLTAGSTGGVSTYIHALVGGIRDTIKMSFGNSSYSLDVSAAKSYCSLDDGETSVVLEATVRRDNILYPSVSVRWSSDIGTVRPTTSATTSLGKTNATLRNLTPGTVTVTATINDGSRDGLSQTLQIYFSSQTESPDYEDEDVPGASDEDYVGDHTGDDDAAVLTDSTQDWVTDGLIGQCIENLTDGSNGIVSSNTNTTVTTSLSGGTDNNWDAGDAYSITNCQNWNAAPTAPTNLALIVLSESQISLSWTDNSNNEYGFEIYSKSGAAGTYTVVGSVGSDITSYIDSGLVASTKYYYKILAYNSADDSDYSNEVSGTTKAAPAVAPTAPSALAATALTVTSVTLTWSDNSNNEDRFIIQKKKSADSEWDNELYTPPNTTTYKLYNLVALTGYNFRVAAENSAGISSYTTASITTTAATKRKGINFISESGTADPDDNATFEGLNGFLSVTSIASNTTSKPDMFSIKVTNTSGYTIDASTVKVNISGGRKGAGSAASFYTAYKPTDMGVLPISPRYGISRRAAIPINGDIYCTFYWDYDDAGSISYTITVIDYNVDADEEADPADAIIEGASVTLNDETKITNAAGQATFEGLSDNTEYPVVITAAGYLDSDEDSDEDNDSITTPDTGIQEGFTYRIYPTPYKIELIGDQY